MLQLSQQYVRTGPTRIGESSTLPHPPLSPNPSFYVKGNEVCRSKTFSLEVCTCHREPSQLRRTHCQFFVCEAGTNSIILNRRSKAAKGTGSVQNSSKVVVLLFSGSCGYLQKCTAKPGLATVLHNLIIVYSVENCIGSMSAPF